MADDTILCENKSEDWEEFLVPITGHDFYNPRNRPEARDTIKSQIMQGGPVCAGMNAVNENFTVWGYTRHSPDDYFPYEPGTFQDHVVIIVGWKDDPSIGQGGYWICKNSWGESFGYDGFFNIEYESLQIATQQIEWVELDPEDYDWHPVPKSNGPYYGLVNEPVQFQGDAAGEHPPFTWHWDFGDDTTSEEQNPSHTYKAPGEYPVMVTVMDSNGGSFYDKTSAWIQETNTPPNTPTIEGPTEIGAEEYCWYNFTFPDPDGNIVYLYVEAFGLESGVWWGPYGPGYEIQNINYSWPEKGEYTVRAKAKDTYGAESDWAVLEVTVPRHKHSVNPFISDFLRNHPHLFPLLQRLLGL
jgi:hypothetical protein